MMESQSAVPRIDEPLLLVDDDEAFRKRLAKSISQRGIPCVEASTYEEAVSLAELQNLAGAVVDLRIANSRGGLETIEAIRRLQRGIPIVMLTGYGSIATALEAVKLGANDYLTKPASVDQILSALELLRSSMSRDAEIPPDAPTLAQVEWEHMQRVLRECEGNITRASKILGIPRRTLQRKLAKSPATI